jgi:hypothetical protein
MGKNSWYESAWIEIRAHLCFLLGHSYAYEPMPGDIPPFEFDHCNHCGKSLSELKERVK